MNREPEMIVNGTPLDFELAELLGEKPSHFLVLCLDGQKVENFGTPYDTAGNRAQWESLMARLNDRSRKSLWPTFFENWKATLIQQFRLPANATAKEFRPAASFKVSRVVCGYSTHLHAAVGLFEKLPNRIHRWSVIRRGECEVEIVSTRGTDHRCVCDSPSVAIVQAVISLLREMPMHAEALP